MTRFTRLRAERLRISANTMSAACPVKVLHYFAFPGGGIGRYVHELLPRLGQEKSAQVELACIPSYQYLSTATYPCWPGLKDITHPVPLIRRLRFAVNLLVNPLRAIRRAKETGAQIIHLSTIPHVTFGLWSRSLRRAGMKLVATAHDVRRSQGLIWYGYEIEQLRRLYRSCEYIFVHSEYQKKDLIDFAGVATDRVVIVPHGPSYYGPPTAAKEELRRRYGIPLAKQVALFFGDIRPDKNLDLFLRAMVPFKERLFLVVAGQAKSRNGLDGRYWEDLVNQLGLRESVLLRLQYVPDQEVPDLFELSDWVAMPYGRRFTSQSGVLNVAMAHRRPVLITATPTIRETIARFEVGVLIEPDDLGSLQAGIGELLDTGGCRFTSGINRYLDVYNWEQNSAFTSEVYRKVASL